MTKIKPQIVTSIAQNSITIDKLKTLLNSGISQRQMARDLGISREKLVRILKEQGLYVPKRIIKDVHEMKALQDLANRRLTVAQMVEESGLNCGQLRHRLEKYGIKNPNLEELKALRDYFSATTLKDRNETFVIVDKYLEQIAKEKYKKGYGISYQDFLQDIRLNFAELAEKRENNINNNNRNLFKKIREINFAKKYMRISKLPMDSYKTYEVDTSIKEFEDSNFLDFRIKNSNLTEKEQLIINIFTKLNKDFNEIAEIFDLTHLRIRQLLKNAIEKMNNSKNIY